MIILYTESESLYIANLVNCGQKLFDLFHCAEVSDQIVISFSCDYPATIACWHYTFLDIVSFSRLSSQTEYDFVVICVGIFLDACHGISFRKDPIYRK